MTRIDWQQIFFGLHDVLMARARRRFGDTPDAESAYNHALEKVSGMGFAALGERYSGRGSPEGFVVVTFVNLMHDYAMAKYGRPRPPAWLLRLGFPWTRIFEMLCLRRLLPETVVDTLGATDEVDRDALRSMIREVRARIPNCGELTGGELAVEDPDTLDRGERFEQAADGAALLEAGEVMMLVRALHAVLEPSQAAAARDGGPDGALAGRLARLGETLAMTNTERMLLRLIYQQGYTISKAARLLDMRDHNARRLHARLIRRLRAELGACGLGPLD